MSANASRLFVGNLSYNTLENDLVECFSQAGSVRSVDVVFDKFTGKSRGFAFVEMGTAEEANKAVEMFHNQELQGRSLTVNVARPKEERPPRNREGGGGGGGYRGDRGGDRGGERGGGRGERGERGDRSDHGDRY
jgi:cold-inducible RNA-binding protein